MPGWVLLVVITRGKQDGSRRNWGRSFSSSIVYCLMMGRSVGLLTMKSDQSLTMLALDVARAGQWRRMCVRLPCWLVHQGSLHRPLGKSRVQCLQRRSVLCPDNIREAITTLNTCKHRSRLDDGWTMKAGWNYSRDGRKEASPKSSCSYMTLALQVVGIDRFFLTDSNRYRYWFSKKYRLIPINTDYGR